MKELKCPSCGASIKKNINNENYVCSHCGTIFIDKDEQQNNIIHNITNISAEKISISSENINNLLNIAEDYINTNKYQEALGYYDKVLAIDDNNTDALIGKIISLFHTDTLLTGEIKSPCYYASKLFIPDINNDAINRIIKKLNIKLIKHFEQLNIENLTAFNNKKDENNAANYLYVMYWQILIINKIIEKIKSKLYEEEIKDNVIDLLKFNYELCIKDYESLYYQSYNNQGELMYYCTDLNVYDKEKINLLFNDYKEIFIKLNYEEYASSKNLEDKTKQQYNEITSKEKKKGTIIFVTAFIFFTIIFLIIFLSIIH